MPIKNDNCFDISVFPTPVGPENKNEPIGLSSSDIIEREILIDETSDSIALS